jgi:hypothetical protein
MEAADLAAEAYYRSNPRSAVGRMFISGGKAHFINEGKESLAIACSVPASCSEKASAKEWLAAVLGACGGEALDAGGDEESAKAKVETAIFFCLFVCLFVCVFVCLWFFVFVYVYVYVYITGCVYV